MPTSPLRWVIGGLFLLVVTLLIYVPTYYPLFGNTLPAGFVWDDNELLVHNPNTKSIQGVINAWAHPSNHGRWYPDYYPLTYTSWWLEYRLVGLDPRVFHLTNVLLHAANAFLFWVILRRLRIPGAMLAAVIFAVHPVNVESVAWISERKNVLSGVLFLLAAWAFIEGWRLPDKTAKEAERDMEPPPLPDPGLRAEPWRIALLALSLLFFVLAMFAKPVAMTLAGVLPLLFWLRRGKLDLRGLAAAAPYLALALPMAWLTSWFQAHHIAQVGQPQNYSFPERILIAGRVVAFYASKLAWPVGLTFAYHKWVVDTRQWWQWLFPVGVVGALAGLWSLRRWLGIEPLIAALFFIITLSPALGFVPILWHRYYFVADHVQYLAGMGLIALGAAAAARWCRDWNFSAMIFAYAAALVLVGSLGWQSLGQSTIYQDPWTLWNDVLTKDPESWMANTNLGVEQARKNQPLRAISSFQTAIKLNPRAFEAQFNLALLLIDRGQHEQAVEHLRDALAAKPNLSAARVRLGEQLAYLHHYREAAQELREATAAAPDSAEGHLALGEVLVRLDQPAQASQEFRLALTRRPTMAEAHYRLADLLRDQHQWDEALEEYNLATRYNPDLMAAYQSAGEIMRAQGDTHGAIKAFVQATRLDPRSVSARLGLVSAFEAANELDAAIFHLRRALELRPDDAEIQDHLAKLEARRATTTRPSADVGGAWGPGGPGGSPRYGGSRRPGDLRGAAEFNGRRGRWNPIRDPAAPHAPRPATQPSEGPDQNPK